MLSDSAVHVIVGSPGTSGGINHPVELILGLVFATVMGGVMAFDVRGFATRQHENNSEFTPWGKALHTSQWANPCRIVGWIFFLFEAFMLRLFIAAGIATLIRHA
jgi:hypothetical protein